MRQIAHLYRVEENLRERKAGPQLASRRAGVEKPPGPGAHPPGIGSTQNEPPISAAKSRRAAIDYALAQWPMLCLWLEDGRIEIDNNLVENAIRPTAIGKKNWLFIGEANAGQRGAILYTIIEYCRRSGIDPYSYLRDVLTRLPNMTNWQIKDVTPEAWAKSKQLPVLKAAS